MELLHVLGTSLLVISVYSSPVKTNDGTLDWRDVKNVENFQSKHIPDKDERRRKPRSKVRRENNQPFASKVGVDTPLGLGGRNKDQPLARSLIAGSRRCPLGEVYVSEVELCLPSSGVLDMAEMVEEMSLVIDKIEIGTLSKDKCPKGMVYVSELDICVPRPDRPPEKDYPPLEKLSLKIYEERPTADPFRLTLAPLMPEQVGLKKCSKGTVYVSEVGLCLIP